MQLQPTPPPHRGPLAVSHVRFLHTEPHPERRPPTMASGSGLVMRGTTAYVVADDELHVGVFDRARPSKPGQLVRVLPGALPLEPKARKAAKPDVEALLELPPSAALPHGALLGVPSGSAPNRTLGFLLPFNADGSLQERPRSIDFSPVLSAFAAAMPGAQLNVEGAVVLGQELLLLNRGASTGGGNVIGRIGLAGIYDALRVTGGARVAGTALAGVRHYDLGRLGGAALAFTDAAAHDGRLVFTAAAEHTKGPIDDGRIEGSAVGWIEADGRVSDIHLLDTPGRKVEGVSIEPVPRRAGDEPDASGDVQLWLATDDDDPSRPSELLRTVLPGANIGTNDATQAARQAASSRTSSA